MAREDHQLVVSQAGQQFKTRVPHDLHARLKDAAKANNRSTNAELVSRLEASFESHRTVAPEIAKLLEDFIQREVEARLLAMARNLTGEK